MPRGGRRLGAGPKPTWLSGPTQTIRVPIALATEIVRLARLLDQGIMVEDVTRSKYLDLSGVQIRSINGRPAVFLDDLVDLGYKIRPFELLSRVRHYINLNR